MTESSDQPTANIGVIGLAVMGSNLARNLARARKPCATIVPNPGRTTGSTTVS